ncbi:MAG TPA: ATP-binding protein [Terriglobales bacterium]|nr:ATP-binding protein [Terriglobales bacterium]
MSNRIFFKLLLVLGLGILAATVTFDLSIRRAWETSLRQEIERNLRQKTLLFANRVNTDRQHPLSDIVAQEGQAAGARATVINAGGQVLADSEANPAEEENDGSEPEFVAALRGEVATAIRPSRTIGVPFLYVAAPMTGGAVRLAYPLSDVEAAGAHIHRTLLWGSVLALAISLVVSAIAARSIAGRLQRIVQFAERIATGDLGTRIAGGSRDEIGQVAASLDRTAQQLQESFAAVQASRRQLETLLNSMQDAVIAVSADNRVQWANQAMERLVPRGTRLQAPVEETVRDPDFLRAVREASEARKVSAVRAGSVVPGRTFDITAAPLPGGGAVTVLRDLTETERVEKTRRDFIANVSHELRTPLTSIQGYTETLLDGAPENNHARDFLEIIRKNATRMSRLTEDLLRLARVESGEQRFVIQPVMPEELLHEALESFHDLARAHNVELQVKDIASQPVNADPEAIHQVFSNLIENALKYAASGRRVVLGGRPVPTGVEFYVRDFGPGIASEHLPRLFERFYRVDKARSRESGGTGLGLAIAKHIVLAHGGIIRAESELHHGSMFVFTLPAAPVAV